MKDKSSVLAELSKDRFDCEGDEIARHFFRGDILQKSPEEYAARHAHEWACFSLHMYRFKDPVLGQWVRRLGEIFFSNEELDKCRDRFLSPAEKAKIEQEEAEGF